MFEVRVQSPQPHGNPAPCSRCPHASLPPPDPAPPRFKESREDRPFYQKEYIKLYFDTVGDEITKVRVVG